MFFDVPKCCFSNNTTLAAWKRPHTSTAKQITDIIFFVTFMLDVILPSLSPPPVTHYRMPNQN